MVVGVCRERRRIGIDPEKSIQSECLKYVQDVLVDINETDNDRDPALPQPQSDDCKHTPKCAVRTITETKINDKFFVSLFDFLHGKTVQWLAVLKSPPAYYAGVDPIIQARNRNSLGWFRYDSVRMVPPKKGTTKL
jgi:hypothetical protein